MLSAHDNKWLVTFLSSMPVVQKEAMCFSLSMHLLAYLVPAELVGSGDGNADGNGLFGFMVMNRQGYYAAVAPVLMPGS